MVQARRGIVLALALLLSSCAGDVRATRLADVDLSNMSVVRNLARRLPTNERAALATYVVRHRVTSSGFCGRKLVGHGGREPHTVGEAIDLTTSRQAEDARREAQKPAWAHRWEALTRERDRLMDRQSLLLAEHGSAAHERQDWAGLQAMLAENGRAMTDLRSGASGKAPAPAAP